VPGLILTASKSRIETLVWTQEEEGTQEKRAQFNSILLFRNSVKEQESIQDLVTRQD
jgi:hypothetical protein